MKNRKNSKLLVLLLLILFLGVGYAAVSNDYLVINGTASATANDGNFNVDFTSVVFESDSVDTTIGSVAAAINESDPDIASITFNFNKKGTMYAIYEIKNKSESLSASITSEIVRGTLDSGFAITDEFGRYDTDDGSFYVDVKPILVAHGEKTYLKVSATMANDVLEDVAAGTFTVNITATPVVPTGE